MQSAWLSLLTEQSRVSNLLPAPQVEFSLFGETHNTRAHRPSFPGPKAYEGLSGDLSKCLMPPHRSTCRPPVRGRPFRAGWPGLLYKVYCPWDEIITVPIRDCPEDGINRKNKLLNDAEMKHPVELVSPSR